MRTTNDLSAVTTDADDQALLREALDYYHSTLKASPDALAYLESRGIRSPEVVERFGLGYANRTLGLGLPEKNRKLGSELRGRLTKLGVFRETGHEHFAGSLVVPVLGPDGDVLQAYGRKIGERLRAGTALHTWLPGPRRAVWNAEGIAGARTVIVAKGLLDALAFWSAGLRSVTALLGPEPHEDLLAALQGARRVLVAFRGGVEGDERAAVLAAKLATLGVAPFRISFPDGEDACDVARHADDPAQALGRLLREAVWLGAGWAPELDEDMVEDGHVEARQTHHGPGGATLKPVADHGDQESLLAPQPALEPQERAASPEAPTETSEHEVVVRLGARRYRIRGLGRNVSHASLRVNLLVTLDPPPAGAVAPLHADTLDLYSARQRGAFVKQAAAELGLRESVVKHDVGKVLLRLEELQAEAFCAALEPRRKPVVISDADGVAALELLRDPRLMDRILADFERVGVVGEETNKLVAYLAAVSRKLEDPLAILIQSSSAAGKTSLLDAVLAFVPEEDRLHFAAMTGQSLFYMGEADLQHRVLAIAEDEGANRASYALKLLQSEGELTIASTGKEATTGRLVAQEYRVRGPVALFLTTTAIDLDEELRNRCLVLTVDEDREQTRAIHRLQRKRETLGGVLARRERHATLKLHRDAQHLLRPLLVVNPYAPSLTFLDDRTRTRRDHAKYLTLIRSIALLHQHQRPIRTVGQGGELVEYIEVTLEDIALANRLAHEVLGRSLDDVPPHTRRLLALLHELVADTCKAEGLERRDVRFTRRAVRERIGWGDTQLKVHLRRLVELEYVAVRRQGQGGWEYELVHDGLGEDGQRFLTGLLDVAELRRSGSGGQRSVPGRPLVGPESGDGRGGERDGFPSSSATLTAAGLQASPKTRSGPADPVVVVAGVVAPGEEDR